LDKYKFNVTKLTTSFTCGNKLCVLYLETEVVHYPLLPLLSMFFRKPNDIAIVAFFVITSLFINNISNLLVDSIISKFLYINTIFQ